MSHNGNYLLTIELLLLKLAHKSLDELPNVVVVCVCVYGGRGGGVRCVIVWHQSFILKQIKFKEKIKVRGTPLNPRSIPVMIGPFF